MSVDPFLSLTRMAIEHSPSIVDGTFASWTDELEAREVQCAHISLEGTAVKMHVFGVTCGVRLMIDPKWAALCNPAMPVSSLRLCSFNPACV
jgi:hypothetical protein